MGNSINNIFKTSFVSESATTIYYITKIWEKVTHLGSENLKFQYLVTALTVMVYNIFWLKTNHWKKIEFSNCQCLNRLQSKSNNLGILNLNSYRTQRYLFSKIALMTEPEVAQTFDIRAAGLIKQNISNMNSGLNFGFNSSET